MEVIISDSGKALIQYKDGYEEKCKKLSPQQMEKIIKRMLLSNNTVAYKNCQYCGLRMITTQKYHKRCWIEKNKI